MSIQGLTVLHLPRQRALKSMSLEEVTAMASKVTDGVSTGFRLDSCQRWIWVTASSDRRAQVSLSELAVNPLLEVYCGTDAYEFLLAVATGLESQIAGEADIFGQFKEAWKKYDACADFGGIVSRSNLRPIFHRLIEDAKEIRSQFLQNVSSASYGSLVRKILHTSKQPASGPTLLLGAGQIAQSVAPWLLGPEIGSELWVWNRSPARASELVAGLADRALKKRGTGLRYFSGHEQEAYAWAHAQNVVICIPCDAQGDLARIAGWRSRSSINPGGQVVHLGGTAAECGQWISSGIAGFCCLDDLFSQQKRLNEKRLFQLAQARRACDEKAKLRSLGLSSSIAHGWEDLALFA